MSGSEHGASAERLTVAFVNNYPMDLCLDWWRSGLIPGQLLYGAQYLGEHGIDVDFVPHQRVRVFDRLSARGLLFVDQQLRILGRRRSDLVFSGHYENLWLLAFLRRRGRLRTPVVSSVFHRLPPLLGPEASRWLRLAHRAARWHDAYLCLSRKFADELIEREGIEPDRVHVLKWGVDLAFYGEPAPPPRTPRPLLLSCGKSDRDYSTLIEAARGSSFDLRIVCDERSVPTDRAVPPNVSFTATPRSGDHALPFTDLLDLYRRSAAVLVPTLEVPHMVGQTSLLEAMAMARAVVMTRGRFLDLDIESAGCGLWVEPGDVKGWRRAIESLLRDPERARAMGVRGRRLCEREFDLRTMSRELARLLRGIRARSGHRPGPCAAGEKPAASGRGPSSGLG